MNKKHIPVLLNSVLDTLGDIQGKTIIDATFGAGGYTEAFLEHGAKVIAFDRDETVLEDVKRIQQKYRENFVFIKKEFSKISELSGVYDAIVFDLGISSMQIDNGERGFSFRADAPLDMRMSHYDKEMAIDIITNYSVNELASILRDYGDVSKAGIIAKAIKEKQPKTTFELKQLIYNPRDIAPVFQALRIAVNDELNEIKMALSAAPSLLKPGGKCIVVTFHSIEDRIVKNTFKSWTTTSGDPRIPIVVDKPKYNLLKAVTPSKRELEINPRAHSAHLRAVQKNHIDQ